VAAQNATIVRNGFHAAVFCAKRERENMARKVYERPMLRRLGLLRLLTHAYGGYVGY
jgi:hypothetical protein